MPIPREVSPEPYPLGKALFLSYMAARFPHLPERGEQEWSNWEEGFMTKAEWQATAEAFLAEARDMPIK